MVGRRSDRACFSAPQAVDCPLRAGEEVFEGRGYGTTWVRGNYLVAAEEGQF